MDTTDQKIARFLLEEDEDKISLIETPGIKIESVQYRLVKHYMCSVKPETTVLEECETHNDLEKNGFEVKMAYLTQDGNAKCGKAFELTKIVDIIGDDSLTKAVESE